MELDLILALYLIIIGFGFGLVSIMIGIGGGILYVTFFIFGIQLLPMVSEGLDPATAGIISSFIIFFTASAGFHKFWKMKRVDFNTALGLLIVAIPASIIGSVTAILVDGSVIKQAFGVFIGAISIYKLFRLIGKYNVIPPVLNVEDDDYHEFEDVFGKVYQYNAKVVTGSPFAFVGGFLAGLLGIGGGVIYMPVMISIVGLPVEIAVATSSFMIISISILSLITKILTLGVTGFDFTLLWFIGIPMTIGTVVGARVSASMMRKIHPRVLQIIFWIVAFLTAVRMII